MTDLAVSRRAVTRALATLPVLGVPLLSRADAADTGDNAMNMQTKIVETADHATWDAAMARMLEAKAHYERTGNAYNNAVREASLEPADIQLLARADDAAGDRLTEAERALLALPCPHIDAFRWKYDFLFGATIREPSLSCIDSLSCEEVEPFFADMWRFLGEA